MMAIGVEESLWMAIGDAFAGKPVETERAKAYLAVGVTAPVVGEPFFCNRIEKVEPKDMVAVELVWTKTSTVQAVNRLAKNVYEVQTRNACYITMITGLLEENIRFAVTLGEPAGTVLNCFKVKFLHSNEIRLFSRKTSQILDITRVGELYRVQTCNSIYYCMNIA